MNHQGRMKMSGEVGFRLVKPQAERIRRFSFAELVKFGYPQKGLLKQVNDWREENWARHVRTEAWKLRFFSTRLGKLSGEVRAWSELHLVHFQNAGPRLDFGLAGVRVVTTAGVGFIVDAFQNSVELEVLKYHGVGTGTNAEAVGDTALQTELTTQYNPDNTRATGSTTEGAANVYRTVGTNSFDASAAITEHGILSQAATGGGTLLDRTVFAAVNVASGDSIQSTYDLTLTAGS